MALLDAGSTKESVRKVYAPNDDFQNKIPLFFIQPFSPMNALGQAFSTRLSNVGFLLGAEVGSWQEVIPRTGKVEKLKTLH